MKPPFPNNEALEAWLYEAELRDREMDQNPKMGVPLDEALERARRSLSSPAPAGGICRRWTR